MNRYDWHYLPASMVSRSGIAVKDLNSSQKLILDSLLQAYLSEEGYKRTKDMILISLIFYDKSKGIDYSPYLVAFGGFILHQTIFHIIFL